MGLEWERRLVAAHLYIEGVGSRFAAWPQMRKSIVPHNLKISPQSFQIGHLSARISEFVLQIVLGNAVGVVQGSQEPISTPP
jgi:hypothetical protein